MFIRIQYIARTLTVGHIHPHHFLFAITSDVCIKTQWHKPLVVVRRRRGSIFHHTRYFRGQQESTLHCREWHSVTWRRTVFSANLNHRETHLLSPSVHYCLKKKPRKIIKTVIILIHIEGFIVKLSYFDFYCFVGVFA